MSQSFSCSALKSTTTRELCELNEDGTWSTISFTISSMRESGTVLLFERA